MKPKFQEGDLVVSEKILGVGKIVAIHKENHKFICYVEHNNHIYVCEEKELHYSDSF